MTPSFPTRRASDLFEAQDMTRKGPFAVVWHNERISSVQPNDAPATQGETVIDGTGGTLVPGLYEMHGHISQGGALLNVAAGITSVRDMGKIGRASCRERVCQYV